MVTHAHFGDLILWAVLREPLAVSTSRQAREAPGFEEHWVSGVAAQNQSDLCRAVVPPHRRSASTWALTFWLLQGTCTIWVQQVPAARGPCRRFLRQWTPRRQWDAQIWPISLHLRLHAVWHPRPCRQVPSAYVAGFSSSMERSRSRLI